jgi:hypothetical protein
MIAIKRMRIKIEKQSKSYIWLKGEIKKKINLVKRQKNIQKNEDQNWHKNKNKNNVLIEGWNWKE